MQLLDRLHQSTVRIIVLQVAKVIAMVVLVSGNEVAVKVPIRSTSQYDFLSELDFHPTPFQK